MSDQQRPVITFSHRYPKLFDEENCVISTATLLDVTLIDLEDLHPAFRSYDTDGGRYVLPKRGAYLQLLFLKPPARIGYLNANLFTTLRRAAPGKHEYYASLVGREFDVRIEEEKK